MIYTERGTEVVIPLGVIRPASYTADQDTGWLALDLYNRAVVILHCGVIGSALYVDVHEATDLSGSGEGEYADSDKDLDVDAADSNTWHVIEIRPEELTPNHHHCIKVTVSGDGQTASIYSLEVLGTVPRYAPVSTAGSAQIND